MITLYGSARSSAGRCFWCLEEVKAPYNAVEVNFRTKEHKSDLFLKINPNGKIPAMVDDDVTLFESMAINFYLAEKYKKDLLGTTLQEKGYVYQWSIWAIAEVQPPIIEAFIQKVFVLEDKRDLGLIEKSLAQVPAFLKILEDRLGESKYLAGNEFTLADLNTASVVSILNHIQYDLSSYKNLSNWLTVLSEREGFRKYAALLQK